MDKTKKKRLYLSLPISGYDIDERRETAMKMEVRLRGAGYEVFNPLGHQWKDGLTHCEYMRRDIKSLLECDVIFFMKGFNRSLGCCTELNVAMACGLDVMFEEQVNIKL